MEIVYGRKETMAKKQKSTIVDVSQNEFCPVSLLLTGQPPII